MTLQHTTLVRGAGAFAILTHACRFDCCSLDLGSWRSANEGIVGHGPGGWDAMPRSSIEVGAVGRLGQPLIEASRHAERDQEAEYARTRNQQGVDDINHNVLKNRDRHG